MATDAILICTALAMAATVTVCVAAIVYVPEIDPEPTGNRYE